MTFPAPEDVERVIAEASDLARQICPFPEEVENGEEVARMPDDLLAAATCLGDLCRAVEHHSALIRELRDALAASDRLLGRKSDLIPAGQMLVVRSCNETALRKANEALGETAN